MAISPISSTSTRSNNINFTAKKQKNQEKFSNPTSNSLTKAIPLATLLAMSPLTAVNINSANNTNASHNIEVVSINGAEDLTQNQREIVASKEFPYNIGSSAKLRVDFVNTTGGEGFDKIEVVTTGKNGVVYDEGEFNNVVKDINTYNLTVISDDGVNQGTISYNVINTKALGLMNDIPIVHDELAQYLKNQLANNPKKDKIPVNIYNRKIAPTLGGGLQNNAKAVNINQADGLDINMSEYEKTAPSRVVKGENDTYTLRFYKGKLDGRNMVTCEKSSNPGNEFRVAMVGNFSATFGKNEYSQTIASYKLTVLRNENDGYGIMDTELGKELQKIKESEIGGNAFICPVVDYEYEVFGKGVLANVTQ